MKNKTFARITERINYGLMFVILLFLLVLAVVLFLDLRTINQNRIWLNMKVVSSILLGGLPLVLVAMIVGGLLTNKWGFKIEKLSLGGFNLLFDNPERLYKRAVISYLDTKRTLFKIDAQRDNFDETLTSYYNTYEFFRNEMKILDNERKRGRWRSKKEQQELYNLTNEIIQMLNDFLTSHQNNFKRWYKYVADKNEVDRIDGEEELLKFHMTPISEIQKQYYRYNEICDGFKEINEFFRTTVIKHFNVNLEKWGVTGADA